MGFADELTDDVRFAESGLVYEIFSHLEFCLCHPDLNDAFPNTLYHLRM